MYYKESSSFAIVEERMVGKDRNFINWEKQVVVKWWTLNSFSFKFKIFFNLNQYFFACLKFLNKQNIGINYRYNRISNYIKENDRRNILKQEFKFDSINYFEINLIS